MQGLVPDPRPVFPKEQRCVPRPTKEKGLLGGRASACSEVTRWWLGGVSCPGSGVRVWVDLDSNLACEKQSKSP